MVIALTNEVLREVLNLNHGTRVQTPIPSSLKVQILLVHRQQMAVDIFGCTVAMSLHLDSLYYLALVRQLKVDVIHLHDFFDGNFRLTLYERVPDQSQERDQEELLN